MSMPKVKSKEKRGRPLKTKEPKLRSVGRVRRNHADINAALTQARAQALAWKASLKLATAQNSMLRKQLAWARRPWVVRWAIMAWRFCNPQPSPWPNMADAAEEST